MKITKSLNHKSKEKTKPNKLKATKKNHLSFMQSWVKWVQGGERLQIYDYPFKIFQQLPKLREGDGQNFM